MNKLLKISFVLFLFNMMTIYSQVIYVPINDNIYKFLDRMNIRNIIELNTEKKPYSRMYIAKKLICLINSKEKITNVDKQLLNWYEAEYNYEIKKITKNRRNKTKLKITNTRWRLFDYSDTLFSFRFSPIVGTGIRILKNTVDYSGWIGARAWFTGSDWFGGMLDLRNIGESRNYYYNDKILSPVRGKDISTVHKNGIEYSDVRVQLNFNWDWGTISLNKDYFEWGNSYYGNLILSDKAPSYPHISFELKPVNWFRFYYIFGWIHSGVIDSSRTIIVNPGEDPEVLFERFVKKYIVANMATFSLTSWFDFSLGNSFIYAGDFRSEMLIPFNFYKFMDRNTGKKDIEDGNGAFYFDLAIRYPNTFKFYSTLFFDVDSKEGSIGTFLNKAWYGFTIGGKKIDFFINNLDLTIEYTRISPWVYEHKYRNLTDYKHLEYSLGHWIEQNSDQIRTQFSYQPVRGLILQIWFEYIRKGGLKDIKYAYFEDETLPFLYSPTRKDNYFGIKINYEIFHELFVEANYLYSNISDEDIHRTPVYLLDKNNRIGITVYYGVP